MGQKVNPISNRLGVIRGWDSNWYGGKKYGDTLLEDSKLRKYLNVRLAKSSVSRIVIERTMKLITITVCTSRPGLIIGKGGSEVDKLKEELKKITDKDVQINIYEVKRPELDAQIVASTIARQIEGKIAYRRAVKMAVASTMRAGAEGIKVQISGRLNGAESSYSTVKHTERAFNFHSEVNVSRSVNKVDLELIAGILPESGGSGRSNCDTTFLFLFHPVHRGSAIVNFADLVSKTGVEKNTLGSSGLTGIDVSHDTDITRIF